MSRVSKDRVLTIITYLSAALAAIILLTILGFIFFKGFKMINAKFIFGQYHQNSYYINIEKPKEKFIKPNNLEEGSYFSEKYGFALLDTYNMKKEKAVQIVYIDNRSPLNNATRFEDNTKPTDELVSINTEYEIKGIYLIYENEEDNFTTYPLTAKDAMNYIESMDHELRMVVSLPGGGIWGSIKTTLIMIGFTLLIALPLGIGIAIFLTEYAHKNKIISVLRAMIDMLTGVPSIVYGIVGVFIFFIGIPRIINYLFNVRATGGETIYGGSLIMVAILLPVVIRATEESLITVPQTLRHASLALGASRTQTITKVVLPSALPGILTAAILSIGRIVGESAALIWIIGTFVIDNPNLSSPGTTLAVQIWSEMSKENPNIELVSGISMIIIFIVLILNITLKLTTKRLSRKFGL